MNVRHTAAFILSCSTFGLVLSAAAMQGADRIGAAGAATPVPATSHAKPTNLKVLPKDISGDDIDKLMHRYEQYLGVPCAYCHEENPQTKELNYASDENPVKETARFMISMTADINNKYLAQLGDRRYAEALTCGNCHQGQVQPPIFEVKPER